MTSFGSNLRFQWNGTAIAAALEAAIESAMEETAQAAVAEARSRARVDTGAMRDSIEATVERRNGAVEMVLGVGVDYGVYHELGSSRISAQPMIRPAIDQEGKRLPERIRAHVGRLR